VPVNDKRGQRRIVQVLPVEAKIQSCPGFHELEGTIFPGATSDVSENGIRLCINQLLPANTFLEMEVKLGERKYLLSGRVMWSQLIDNTTAHIGIMFTSENESQMWSWKNQLSRVFNSEK